MMNSKPLTAAQLKKIQTMFSQLGIEGNDKQGIIYSLTSKRATSTKDITYNEAKYLIEWLEAKANPENAANEKEARSIVQRIYEISFALPFLNKSFRGKEYDTYEDKMMNFAKINKFCRERGTVKKDITSMNLFELKQTLRQFEAMNKLNEYK